MSSEQKTGRPLRVLVVDDEKNIRTTLALCLELFGDTVAQAATALAALQAADAHPFDVAFVDLRLGQASGLDLIPALLSKRPTLEVIIITAFGTVDSAVEAMKLGARDFVAKPFTPAQIRQLVDRVRDRQALTSQVSDLQSRLAQVTPEIDLESRSSRMQQLLELAKRAADSDAPVLLRGESGTGKSVLARALHAMSARSAGPFVTVNCPTLSEELLASELFGHAKGSFTGAVRDQPGRMEMAEGGTVLLDEIAELSSGLQAKLLRFLQDKQFERLGEHQTRTANVRVVAATNRPLEDDVASGKFRRDLLYRLNVVELVLPPLRERPEDILPLAKRFLGFFARSSRRPAAELSSSAEQLLGSHSWPGNIRELRNAIERALIVWPAPRLEPAAFALQGSVPAATAQVGDNVTLDELEREHIQRVLARSKSTEEAAQILGVDASTLYRKRKRYES